MLLVTGASGHIGGAVARLLVARGLPVRVLVRDEKERPRDLDVDVRIGEYADAASIERALEDVTTAFFVSASAPPGERAKLHRGAFEAAARTKVEHVVYLSLAGAAPNSHYAYSRDHWESEESLRETKLPHTILRNGKYTEQILEPEFHGAPGTLWGPRDAGEIAWISRADSARVIAAICADPPGGIVHYAGSEAISIAETARRLEKAFGLQFTYGARTPDAARDHVREESEKSGKPARRADLAADTYRAISAGEYAEVHDASKWIERVESIEETVLSGALDALKEKGASR